jgi:V/A-type H+-transporting ATPase subunit K
MKSSVSPVLSKLALGMVAAALVWAALGTLLLAIPQVGAEQPSAALVIAMDAGIWQWGLLAAALATGLSSLGAGYAVARIGTAAMGTLAEKPELFGRMIIFVGLAEGIAIYGLIISVLILNRLA